MLRAALRNLAAHRVRLALTTLAIVLGVSFVAGTLVFTDSLQKSFSTLVDQRTADVQVEPRGPAGGTQGGPPIADTPRSLPASLIEQVSGIDGVAVAEGYVTTRSAVILGADGRPLGGQGGASSGRSWVNDAAMNPLSIAEGSPPVISGEIVLDRSTARRANVVIGDEVTVALPRVVEGRAVATMRLVGILDDSLSATFGGGTLAAFTLADAQRLFLSADRVSSVRVRAQPGVTQDALAQRISSELAESPAPRDSVIVTTGQQQIDRATARVQEQLGFLTTFLLVFALIALFVASFLIFNTFTMLVAQRTKELALLRALGASRGQVQRSVLLEAFVVALVGSLLGLVVGLGLALLLRGLFAAFGASLPGGSLVVTPRTVLVSIVIGVVATMLCAWFPARRAARIPPVAALRDDVALPQRSLRIRAIVSAVLVAVAAALAVRGIAVAAEDSQQAAQSVGLSALLALIAAIASAAFLARPVLALIGAPLRGVVGRLARENGRRNPRRTAATSTALMIGVALMASLSVVASSATASVAALVDETVGADFVLTGAGFRPFPAEVVDAVRDTPGVSVVTPVRQTAAQVGTSNRIPVTGVEPQDLSRVLSLTIDGKQLASLGPGETLVDSDTAATLGLGIGGSADVTLLSGSKSFDVVGLFEPVALYRGFIVPMSSLVLPGSDAPVGAVYIGLGEGVDANSVGAEIDRRLAPYPVVQVQNQAQIKASVQDQVGSVLGFIFALLALAVIIAVLGIVNTLLLSVAERTREIGLVRAVGATRGQVRRMVILESVLIALFGALVGVVLGVVYGVLLQRSLAEEGIGVLDIPAVRIVVLLIFAAFAGVIAALWPAVRASRLNVLRAISVS